MQYEQVLLLKPEEYRRWKGIKAVQPDAGSPFVHSGPEVDSICRTCAKLPDCEFRKDFVQKYRCWKEAFGQIPDEEKWEYINRMRDTFWKASKKHILREEMFDDLEWDEIQELFVSTADYYAHLNVTWQRQEYDRRIEQQTQEYEKRMAQLVQEYEKRVAQLMRDIRMIKHSKTWKLGRALVYLPQKILRRKGCRKR